MRKRWMIGGVVFLALAVGYSGYWFWLAQTFERNLALWIEQQRAMGYRISYSASEARGFPLWIQLSLNDLLIESHSYQSSWRVRKSDFRASLAPWSPLTLRIAHGFQDATYTVDWDKGPRTIEIDVPFGKAEINLAADGGIPAFDVRGGHVFVYEHGQEAAMIHGLEGRVAPLNVASSLPSSTEFSVIVTHADVYELAQSPFGTEIADAEISGRVVGTIPATGLGAALDSWRNSGGTVELTRIAGRWGPLGINADGTLALDERLQPIGAFTAEVRGFNEAIDAAVTAGLMTPNQGTAAKVWLNARAENDDSGFKVTLPLTVQDGVVSTGSIKLAQMPDIKWE